VVAVIAVLYVTYVFFHCVRLLQRGATGVDLELQQKGTWQLASFLFLSTMLLICYVRSILVSPGEIPDSKDWMYYGEAPEETGGAATVSLHETKQTGERRHCKWCTKYKPDRAHHCRVCRTCILKMDHHCPWIYNCVGQRNHKFFFLLLFYTVLTLHLIVYTMGGGPEPFGVRRAHHPIKTLLSSEKPSVWSAEKISDCGRTPREQDDIPRVRSVFSSSQLSSRDTNCKGPLSSREAPAAGRMYGPKLQEPRVSLRLGKRASSASKRDLFGRTSFEASLRS
jgi:hypothetical protein